MTQQTEVMWSECFEDTKLSELDVKLDFPDNVVIPSEMPESGITHTTQVDSFNDRRKDYDIELFRINGESVWLGRYVKFVPNLYYPEDRSMEKKELFALFLPGDRKAIEVKKLPSNQEELTAMIHSALCSVLFGSFEDYPSVL